MQDWLWISLGFIGFDGANIEYDSLFSIGILEVSRG